MYCLSRGAWEPLANVIRYICVRRHHRWAPNICLAAKLMACNIKYRVSDETQNETKLQNLWNIMSFTRTVEPVISMHEQAYYLSLTISFSGLLFSHSSANLPAMSKYLS